MDFGIGLPTQIPDVAGKALVGRAVRAEKAGFSSLGTMGRLVYPNYDDLIALAAAAAVAKRIRLTTSVLLEPRHANVALLAEHAASLDRLLSADGGSTRHRSPAQKCRPPVPDKCRCRRENKRS